MARRVNTIQGRLVLMLLLIQAVLMPPLFFVIDKAVERTMTDAFVDDARLSAQLIADGFASLDATSPDSDVIDLLDTAMLGGHSTYAALQVGDSLVTSSLMSAEEGGDFVEDFAFGDHGDNVYYLSLPISTMDVPAALRLGLDETQIAADLDTVQQTTLFFMLGYLILSVIVTGLLSSSIVGPLKWLQRASHSISSGDVSRELKTSSKLIEIQDLSEDLEKMRRNLVGMNERLHEEMQERENAEAQRRGMEDQLRQAQRLESLGTLAGGVAHEFNNVLQPILMYTDLALEEAPEKSVTAKNLKRVIELAGRARNLSRQILTFGRQEQHAEFQLTDIRFVVYEALTMIRALLPATVNLRAEIGQHTGLVNCDPAQIKQLIVNLCNNASQALSSPEDYIEVSLTEVIVTKETTNRQSTVLPGEYVVLQVADTGQGMDEVTAQRVFEPFFTTRGVGEGTGLGLSVVHGIVKRHDGEILIDTKPGEGTRFRIYLPLADEVTEEISNVE